MKHRSVFQILNLNCGQGRPRPWGRRTPPAGKLVEWLLEARDKPLMRRKYAEAMEVVNAEINIFCEELARQFSSVLERNGAFAEVVYVYGGGATPVQKSLYRRRVRIELQVLVNREIDRPLADVDADDAARGHDVGCRDIVRQRNAVLGAAARGGRDDLRDGEAGRLAAHRRV